MCLRDVMLPYSHVLCFFLLLLFWLCKEIYLFISRDLFASPDLFDGLTWHWKFAITMHDFSLHLGFLPGKIHRRLMQQQQRPFLPVDRREFQLPGVGPSLSLSLYAPTQLCICCIVYLSFFFLFLLYFNTWNYCVFNIRKIAWRYFTLVRPFITVATCCSWAMHMKKKRNKIRKRENKVTANF